MHIDFAPPSNGTYNNAGSSRQLANYLEHEDLERMEKGIYTEDFFNLADDNIYKSKVIKDIDSNIGQLLKTDYITGRVMPDLYPPVNHPDILSAAGIVRITADENISIVINGRRNILKTAWCLELPYYFRCHVGR